MKRGAGKGIPFVLGALLLFVLFSALRMGTATLLDGHARSELDAWIRNGELPDASRVSNISSALAWAQRFAPDNPEPLMEQARLSLLRASTPGLVESVRMDILSAGLDPLRRALALRPASPYSWALLLQLKQGLGQYDAEFRRAMERTVTLGPWETGLHPIVLDAGLRAWSSLPEAEREMVKGNYRRGLDRDAGLMLQVAMSHRNGCVVASGYDGCEQ